eukprot:5053808-Pleurochrysis_carterae.AAC.1
MRIRVRAKGAPCLWKGLVPGTFALRACGYPRLPHCLYDAIASIDRLSSLVEPRGLFEVLADFESEEVFRTLMLAHTWADAGTLTRARARVRVRVRVRARERACARACVCACSSVGVNEDLFMRARRATRRRSTAHALTHTHTHTRKRTDAHAYARACAIIRTSTDASAPTHTQRTQTCFQATDRRLGALELARVLCAPLVTQARNARANRMAPLNSCK